ncbi:MAG: YfhO family protein, partial [Acutalibacteraceae bacterium]|nr:YfhO family protein [Acutalibacteraceae bacterium]
IFIVTYCLVFALMRDKKYQQSTVAVLLLCCVVGELACANTDRYNMDQPKSNFTGDYSDFRTLKDELDEYNGDDMYRMELTYNRARMDPAWYGYNGISTFTSMAYEKMSNTQSDLGLDSNYINSYTYYLQTPVYNMMHALKYVVDNSNDVTVEGDYFNELMTQGKFTAYENKYHLPIGFGVNSDITNWYSDLTNPFIVQGNWFEYATGVSDVFGMMTIDEVQYYNMDELTSGLETGDIYYTKTAEGEGELTFILRTDTERHCYLYVNSRDFDSLKIEKDDTEYTQYVDEPYVYDLGIVGTDEEVKVRITIEDVEYGYIDFYPYYVNDEALNKGYEILRNRQLNVTSFEETKIQGNVSLDEDCAFFTSIPYDSGWTVKVDGKKVEKEDFIYFSKDDDNNPEYTYLCFNIPAGEHTVEFSFMPDGLILGIAVSVATVIALIIAAIIFSIIRKKRANIPDFVPEIPVAEEEIKAIDLELDSFSAENTNEEKPEVQEPNTAAETAETSEESAEETFT